MADRKKRNKFRRLYFELKNLPWTGIISILVGTVWLFVFTQQWILGYVSLNWQMTEGKITTSEAVPCRRKALFDSHRARIIYEYSVNGILYSSYMISFTTDSFSPGCGSAEEIMAQYPLGKQVPVYYNPQNPEQAVLHPGGTSFASIGLSLAMFIYGLKILADRSGLTKARRPKRILQKKVRV